MTLPHPPAPLSRAGAETRCADCAHLLNGCCEPAAETLAEQGWPGVAVRPAPWARARDCPGFEPGGDYLEALREPGERRDQEALERGRGFFPHEP